MGQTYETYYKRHNGEDWDIYYFRTSAALVGETSARKFISNLIYVNGVAFNLSNPDVSGAKATVRITGANIGSGITVGSGETLYYITATGTVANNLKALDYYLHSLADGLPENLSHILTTDNYSTTLDSVYQGLNATLTALGTLGANSNVGYLKKTAANTYTLENKTFVETSRKINGQALSSDLNFYATNLYMSSANGASSISDEILALKATLNASTQAYSIRVGDDNYTVPDGYSNNLFKVTTTNVTINLRTGPNTKLKGTNGQDIFVKDLNIGDDLYIENGTYPDRWVSAKTEGDSITFTVRIEARQTWDSITGKPTSAADMISQLNWSDLKIDSGVVTIGANTITPLTTVSLPSTTPVLGWGGTSLLATISDNAGHSYNINVTMPSQPSYTDTKNTAGATNKNNTKMWLIASPTANSANPQTYENSKCYIGTDNCLYSNERKTSTQVVTTGNTAPSSPQAGDLWFDTTVPSA